MKIPLTSQISMLAGEVKALATGHLELLRLEMAGKVRLTRRQTILMAAGAVSALTGVLLLLAGITLLLSWILVSQADWTPLAAGTSSAFLLAILSTLTGILIIRNGSNTLRAEGLAPQETIRSLRQSAATLTNQAIEPQPTPIKDMNTSKQFRSAVNHTAETIENQTRRAGRAVRDTAESLNDRFDPGAFFSNVMGWVDDLLHPHNRALAGRALSAAALLPRRHPVPSALIGFGAAWMLWRKMNQQNARQAVETFSETGAETCRDFVDDTSKAVKRGYRAATDGAEAAVRAGRDVRNAFNDATSRWAESGRATAATLKEATSEAADRARGIYDDAREYVSDGLDRFSETSKQLRKEAGDTVKKAQDFAREEPLLTIAGGIALAVGAALLVKSSRR